MEGYKRQHYVPKSIIKNFRFNDKSTHIYKKKTDEVIERNTKNTFMQHFFYRSNDLDNSLEIEMGKTIENDFAQVLQDKVYEKDEIILNRKELNTIKKFLLLQFLRTDFYKEKFDKAPSMIRNRMKNETPREQWIRYLKYVVSHNVDEMTKNADSPDLIKFHAKVINQLTYLCFQRWQWISPFFNV